MILKEEKNFGCKGKFLIFYTIKEIMVKLGTLAKLQKAF